MRLRRALVLAACAGVLAGGVAMRVSNALRYPADWGFDATYNWRYIYRLGEDRTLPRPDAGWSTADPPLFFAGAALLLAGVERIAGRSWLEVPWSPLLVPLANTALGLAVVALAVLLVRGAAPGDRRRAFLAAALLLYLPAHVAMSAMVAEEMLAAFLTSAALVALLRPRPGSLSARGELARAAGVGLLAGLAWLTKVSGVLAVLAAAATAGVAGVRRAPGRRVALQVAALLLVAGVAGGWYYARNRVRYGYFLPFGLPAHRVMFEQPPGERSVGDYLRFPMATFTDPQLLHPDLLRSVWGSTFASVWFDGHRYFLPRDDPGVTRLGTATLVLALLPTAAFLLGAARGARRVFRERSPDDVALLSLSALTLAGFVFYTWQNPWFTVVKGTTLLGLSLPFAYYASEVLADWTRRRPPWPALVGTLLTALAVCATLASTFDLAFEKTEISGLPWRDAP